MRHHTYRGWQYHDEGPVRGWVAWKGKTELFGYDEDEVRSAIDVRADADERIPDLLEDRAA